MRRKGRTIEFSFVGSHVGKLSASSCTTVGTTGSCSVTDSSTTGGLDEVQASTNVTVLGVSLSRATKAVSPAPTAPGSCQPTPTATAVGVDAVKCWVDANVSITPNGTNAVGA